MMIQKCLAAATMLVAMCAPASAVLAAQPSGVSQPRTAQNDPNRRVCRTIIPTGSRMGERVCRTQAEWDRQADRAQRDAADQNLNHGGRDGEGPLSSGAAGPR